MVVAKLYGGLGNQMYQFAAGTALSLRLGTSLYVDTGWFEIVKGHPNATERTFELGVFGISAKKPGIVTKLTLHLNPLTVFQEEGFNYQPGFEKLSGNVALDGYWQSYKYFEGCSDHIRKLYQFVNPPSKDTSKALAEIKGVESISLHIRRGDYVNQERTKFIGVLPINYYEAAIKNIEKRTKNPVFFVFSDEPEWCKQNLKLPTNTIFISDLYTSTTEDDLRLMSACKHHIIANSSYSWWGAWLNSNPEKIVCAPKRWFAETKVNLDDRLPKVWLKV